MDYGCIAQAILSFIEDNKPIPAIKLARTATFASLTESKAVVDYICEQGVESFAHSGLATYMEIRRMTSGDALGTMRSYNLSDIGQYNSAIAHLSIIMEEVRASNIIEGIAQVCGNHWVSITVFSPARYTISLGVEVTL